MKRLALILALMLPTALWGQSDSAAIRIVERYLGILNIEAIPADSMLVLNTQIVYPATHDTLTMRRLYATPQMFRVDVYDSRGKLQTGLCGNGTNRYRLYDRKRGWWGDITRETFFNKLYGFDFRGPLYTWRSDNAELTYRGKADYKGQQLDVVEVSTPGFYKRTYMFEPSGMLSVILESLENSEEDYNPMRDAHIDWKCFHEYQLVGNTILPSLESFSRDNELTILSTEARFEKRDNLQFNQD